MILSMLDNKEIGPFEQNSFDSFLCTGITLAIFSTDGKTPEEKHRSNMSTRWVEISCFNSFKVLVGRLFEPGDLSLFREDIINFTSCASVGVTNNDSSLGWWRNSWNDLFENLILALVFTVIKVK